MPTRWIATMAVIPVLLTTACAPPASIAPPSPPAEARPLTETGPHDQRLDDVIRELRDALETRYGRLEVKVYKLPAGSGWTGVVGHYQGALAGWSPEPALPEQIRAAHARAWKHDGNLLAIALIDTPVAGVQSDYAVLLVADKAATH